MHGLIDIHHHLIRAIENEPSDWETVVEMLKSAASQGVETIIATPHVIPGMVEFDWEEYNRNLAEIQSFCRENALPVTVLGGAELYFTDATIHFLQEHRIPTLNKSRFILVEWKTSVRKNTMLANIRDLANAGFIPVIAHGERYDCLTSDIRFVNSLKVMSEVRLQVNCSSIFAKRHLLKRNTVANWLSEELIDYVASDAHNTTTRPVNLAECYNYLSKTYSNDYADALMRYNQLEIIQS